MNRGKKVKFLLITVFILALTVSSLGVKAGDDDDDDDDVYFAIAITDAYYMDFEDLGVENDVVVDFIVKLYLDDDIYEDYKLSKYTEFTINLDVELELPSSQKYKYNLLMKVTDGRTYAKLVFFNHATESGWYETSIQGYISVLKVKAYDWCIFDPPGGDDEDVPRIELFY